MAKAASPTRFSGDMDHFYDPTFTQEISQKMRVPKRIKVDGETEDDVTNNLPSSSWIHQAEKINMHVPDRILVMDNIYMDSAPRAKVDDSGQEQHFGTRAPPRELQLENSVMPPDPGVIRVQTPPRVITLEEHCFPSADDEFQKTDSTTSVGVVKTAQKALDLEPRYGNEGGMSTGEEVIHLRRQLSKLNRRVMNLELEYLEHKQREKILYALITGYFLVKGLIWLNRS